MGAGLALIVVDKNIGQLIRLGQHKNVLERGRVKPSDTNFGTPMENKSVPGKASVP